jgi:energy-coupling factor transporter transmembrane protein EcfT
MQPGQPRRPPTFWLWAHPALSLLLFFGAVLLFFQTRDPMLLIFGVVAVAVLNAVFAPWRWGYAGWYGSPGWGWWGGPAQQIVKVKCASCGALNDEHARYCSACGRPM